MEFQGFTTEDFNVFTIDGLEPRMEAMKQSIRPKLEVLGDYFAPTLAALTGDEMFVHVAKHARRTINPPMDTWVAFASNPRGYKMLPHFQIGLWNTHLFIWFAVINEASNKIEIGSRLEKKIAKIYKETPKEFMWSLDHTKPEAFKHEALSKKDLEDMFERLGTIKKAELLCGFTIDKDEVIKLSGKELLEQIDSVFKTVAPLYQIARG